MLRSELLLETTALGQYGLGQIPLFLSGLDDPQVQLMAVDRGQRFQWRVSMRI